VRGTEYEVRGNSLWLPSLERRGVGSSSGSPPWRGEGWVLPLAPLLGGAGGGYSKIRKQLMEIAYHVLRGRNDGTKETDTHYEIISQRTLV
jgi:hypothetical protein